MKRVQVNNLLALFFIFISLALFALSVRAGFDGELYPSLTLLGLSLIVAIVAKQRIPALKLNHLKYQKNLQILAFLVIGLAIVGTL